MASERIPVAFRLTKLAVRLLDRMKEQLGISRVAVIEMAVREKAEKIGLLHTKE